MDPLLIALGVLAILVGLFGVVVPLLPGLVFVWAGTAGTLLAHRADATGWVLAAVLTLLLVLGSVATIVLPARTGVRAGASLRSLTLAAVGGVLGFFLIPVLGFPLGAVAGLAYGEWQRLGAWGPARDSTVRVLRAYGLGVLVEFGIGVTMAVIWLVAIVTRG